MGLLEVRGRRRGQPRAEAKLRAWLGAQAMCGDGRNQGPALLEPPGKAGTHSPGKGRDSCVSRGSPWCALSTAPTEEASGGLRGPTY